MTFSVLKGPTVLQGVEHKAQSPNEWGSFGTIRLLLASRVGAFMLSWVSSVTFVLYSDSSGPKSFRRLSSEA
jgi:hypothetical protein